MSRAMYAFSGDPITFGHIDIIRRAAVAFDHVTVGIGLNPQKKYLFTLEERTDMARRCLRNLTNVDVISFTGLLVDYAYEHSISVIVKGVRNAEDFNYENILHQVGQSQKLGIDTHILFADPTLAHVSSSAVKEIQKNQGLIHEYVPLPVKQKLEAKISRQYIVGVTGEMGVGKSYISQQLELLKSPFEIHNIELDHIAHHILGDLPEPAYQQIRQNIAAQFGSEVVDADGFINRRNLGRIVFSDPEQLSRLNQIMAQPILVRLRRELASTRGLILVNAALLVETEMTYISNNNILLVTTDKETQRQRLQARNLSRQQIQTRLACQYTYKQKQSKLQEIIRLDACGHIWTVDNPDNNPPADLESTLEQIARDLEIT